MTELFCIVAVLMSALSLIIALVGAVMTLRLGKGLTVHVITAQAQPAVPTAEEIAKHLQIKQAEADKARQEATQQSGLDDAIKMLNEIMLGGVDNG